jgi:type II secretory pathway pseudopilin PulG
VKEMKSSQEIRIRQQEGFTLTELMVSLFVTTIVGGMSLQALVNSQKDFSEGRTNIENGQKLSSVLDIIRRDVQQAGENISEERFPVVSVVPNGVGGSKVILYRALQDPLPICTAIGSTIPFGIPSGTVVNQIVTSVYDNDAFLNANPSCRVDRPTPLPSTYPYPPSQLSAAGTDSWEARRTSAENPTNQGLIHNGNGQIQLFTYTGNATGVQSNSLGSGKTTSVTTNAFTTSTNYNLGSNIYLIEKREYFVCGNTLKVVINSPDTLPGACPTDSGSTVQTIATNIEAMNITMSLREAGASTTAPDVITSTAANASFPNTALTPPQTWQNIQGMLITLQAKDPEGKAFSSLSATEKAKLTVEGKFYPRNILSAKRTR